MMRFKKASLQGELIEWLEESDDEELGAARLRSCRQALEGGSVGASNGVRIEVGRGLGDKPGDGDGCLFWLGETRQGQSRLCLVLGDNMEEAGEEVAVARMVGAGNPDGSLGEAGKHTVTVLLQERPILVTRHLGKAFGARVEAAMKEVALGVAMALDEPQRA